MHTAEHPAPTILNGTEYWYPPIPCERLSVERIARFVVIIPCALFLVVVVHSFRFAVSTIYYFFKFTGEAFDDFCDITGIAPADNERE